MLYKMGGVLDVSVRIMKCLSQWRGYTRARVALGPPNAGLTATKTVAFATKNINLRVIFMLRSPLATI